jgi:hypothetical protein
MAIVRLALENPSANTDTLLHTAIRQSLVSVISTNKSTVPATVRIWIQPTGSSSSADYAYLAYDTIIPANNSLETFRVALEVGDVVYVRSSTPDISFSLNGIHESSGNYNKVFVQDTLPTATNIGDVWVSEELGYVKFWDGSTWVNAVPGSAGFAQTNQPSFPQEGQLWVDLDGVPTEEPGYANVIYSPTEPTALDITDTGTIWIDSDTNEYFVWDGTDFILTTAPSSSYQSTAPSSPQTGQIWVDSDDGLVYVWSGSAWEEVGGGGATGGGSNKVFFENDVAVTANYTIESGKNAGSFGPVTINSGATVTVPSGSVWSVI